MKYTINQAVCQPKLVQKEKRKGETAMFERKKALKEIEEKLNAVQMYLENNYKDLTIQSYKEAKEVVAKHEQSDVLKQKDIEQIQKRMSEFDAKLVHYGHTNVSEFLKERY
jgi:hypothetical protein